MSTISIIFLAIVSIIVLLLLIALVLKKEYSIKREITIDASRQKVFDYIRHLRNQDNYSKWVMTDPAMKKEFKGTDGTVGFIYGWNGNKKAGEGEQEIKSIKDGESIYTEVRFVRPFPGVSYLLMAVKEVVDSKTKVSWGMNSSMKFPINIMIPMIKSMLGKDLEISLNNLKMILEK